MKFTFNSERLHTSYDGTYCNGTKAISILDENCRYYCTLTVSVENTPKLKDNEFVIKTWSENAEIAAAILKTGKFKDTGKRITTGFTKAEIWEEIQLD